MILGSEVRINVKELSSLIILCILQSLCEASSNIDTKLGCEGSTVSISCSGSTYISIVRANYGRFSISVCNVQATEWDTDCDNQLDTTHLLRKMWVEICLQIINLIICYQFQVQPAIFMPDPGKLKSVSQGMPRHREVPGGTTWVCTSWRRECRLHLSWVTTASDGRKY